MSRYLRLLRGVLLDEHYLENELRIAHLLAAATTGAPVDGQRLADPARYMTKAYAARERRSQTGELPASAESAVSHLALADIGRARLDHLEACVTAIASDDVTGDLVDCGSERPGAAIYLSGLREELALTERDFWVSGLFMGSDSLTADGAIRPSADLNATRQAFARFDLLDGVRFLQGPASETLAGAPVAEVALLRLDGHDPAELEAALEALYDRVSEGGFVVIDDYGDTECRQAVDAFRAAGGIAEPMGWVDAGAAAWRKGERAVRSRTGPA
ncbi:MAG: TylF/MycF family methyltransferase, partial [Actinomycetota bacterium]|nr:TylF/MycF family methyltransferase [Actinomycetota bacterium]